MKQSSVCDTVETLTGYPSAHHKELFYKFLLFKETLWGNLCKVPM